MARDWHYTIPNSLYRAPPPIFLLACASCYCSFLFVVFVLLFFIFFHASLWSFVDVPRIFFLSSRLRTGLATTYITEYWYG